MKFLFHVRVSGKDYPYATFRIFKVDNNLFMAEPLTWFETSDKPPKVHFLEKNGALQASAEENGFITMEIINKLCSRIEATLSLKTPCPRNEISE